MKNENKKNQMAIAGVSSVLSADADQREARRQDRMGAAGVAKGAVYGYGLAHPPPGILPAKEAGITALVTHGALLFGATSGEASHLFWMDRPFGIADLGVIRNVKETAATLVVDGAGVLWGGARDRSGSLFTYDTKTGIILPHSTTEGPIKYKPSPLKNEGVASLAISADKTTIAGVGDKTGRLFLMNAKTRKAKVIACVSRESEPFSKVLGAGADNFFYATGRYGEVIRISVAGEMKSLAVHLPCKKGKAYLARASSFACSETGKLWGGTAEGYLFSFDLPARELICHGRGNDIPDLHCLVIGKDGIVYGITGRGKDIAHLVSYDPRKAEWSDLGIPQSYGAYPWTGYHAAAMALGAEGQIYIGENDNFGHLFIYHPPQRPISENRAPVQGGGALGPGIAPAGQPVPAADSRK